MRLTRRSEKILDYATWVITALAVVAGVLAIGFILWNSGYARGYCHALGGETIGSERVCNVDGRVVEIPQ